MTLSNHAKLRALAARLDAQRWSQHIAGRLNASTLNAARLARARAYTSNEVGAIMRLASARPGISTPALRQAYNDGRVARGLRPVGVARFHALVHSTPLVPQSVAPGARVFWFPQEAQQQAQGVPA